MPDRAIRDHPHLNLEAPVRRKVASFLLSVLMLSGFATSIALASPSAAAKSPVASLKEAGFVKLGTVKRRGTCKNDGVTVSGVATWEKWQQKRTGKIRYLRVRFSTKASRKKGDDFAHLEVWATSGPSSTDGSPDKTMNFAFEGSAVAVSTKAAFLAVFYRWNSSNKQTELIICQAFF